MALGNANTSAQSRGKNKPVIVKRRAEVEAAKNAVSITATVMVGANAQAACSVAGGSTFDQEYFTISYSGSAGAYFPNVGSKVYTRPRINDKFALTEGSYLFKASGSTYYLSISSSLTVAARAICR